MMRGSTLSSCFLICGDGAGATPFSNLSNSSLVMTVLHSPVGAAAAVFPAVVVLAAAPVTEAGRGRGAHTPFTVITAAVGGTEADVSGGAEAIGEAMPGIGPGCAGGGVPGPPCPQTNVPNKAHSSQRIRITHFLQRIGRSEKSNVPNIKS